MKTTIEGEFGDAIEVSSSEGEVWVLIDESLGEEAMVCLNTDQTRSLIKALEAAL